MPRSTPAGRAAAALALLLLAAAAPAAAGEADDLRGAARDALAKGDAAAAIAALERARLLEPKRADVCRDLGKAYEADGQVTAAIAHYGEAARLDAGAAGAAARADEARLRARWIQVEIESGDEARGAKRFREARESYERAFEIAGPAEGGARARARERYLRAGAAELAAGILAGAGESPSVAILTFDGIEPGGALADLAEIVRDEVARELGRAGARVLAEPDRGAATVLVEGSVGSRVTFRATAAGAAGRSAGGEGGGAAAVLAAVALKPLADLDAEGRSPRTDTPAAAAAEVARALAETIARKAPGARVALAPLAGEGDPARARALAELLGTLLRIELGARAGGRFTLASPGARVALAPLAGEGDPARARALAELLGTLLRIELGARAGGRFTLASPGGQGGVRIGGTLLVGDTLATARLAASADGREKPLGAATAVFGVPATSVGEPLELQVEVLAQTLLASGEYADVAVKPAMTLRSGDQLQVRFQVSRPAYVYVLLHSSGTNEAVRVFPDAKIKLDNHAKRGVKVVLPAEDLWFVLDENAGTETLYVLAADEPLDDLDRLLDRLAEAGAAAARTGGAAGRREAFEDYVVKARGFRPFTAKTKPARPAGSAAGASKALTDVVSTEGRVVWTVAFEHR